MRLTAFRSSWPGEVTTFLAAWNNLAVLALFRPLREDLGVSGTKLVWVAVAFDVAAATTLRGGASWSRRAGSRVVLAVGAAAFAATSAGCALASGWAALVALRAAQGAAAAVALAAAFDRLTDVSSLTGDRREVRNGGLGAALAGGPLLACAGTVHDWRLLFWSDAVVGAVVCAAVLAGCGDWRRERAARVQREPFDVAALVLVGAALVGAVGALAEAGAAGWYGVPTLTLLVFGLLALVPVLAWETPLGGGHRRAFAAAQVADLCLFASVSGVLLLLAGYSRSADGVGPLGIGTGLLIWSASVAVGLPVAASIDVHRRAVMIAGLLLHTAALLATALLVAAHESGFWLAVPLSLSGLGVALALPAARHTAVTVAGMRRSTGVTSGVGAVRLAGSALGTALFATVSAPGGPCGLGTPTGRLMVPAVTAGMVAAAGAAAALVLPRSRRRPRQHIA
jgi:MFS family permease